jgi:hypothetical protein
MNADKRLVLVLGMHRSGTSALTKGLQALGVDLGSNFNPATPDNPTGFWEDKNFHALNEEMLKHLHRSWDDLQLVESDTVLSGLEGFFPRAKALLDDFLRDKFVAGLKDPRFSLLLPFWKKVSAEVGVRVSFVVGFRNPLSVAESLSRRDDFPKIKGLWLWTLHHVFIAAGTTDVPHLVVDYDKMLDDPHSQLGRIACFLGLTPKTGSLEIFCSEFLQPDLRHARHSTADLQEDQDCNPIVLDIHEHFSAESSDIAPAGSISWVQAASRWEHPLRPFKGLLQLSSVLGQEKTALKTQAVFRELEFHEQLKSLEADHSSVVQKNAELVQKNAALEQEAAKLDQKNTALDQKAAKLDQKNTALEQEAAQLTQKNTALEQEAAQLTQKNTALEQEAAQLTQKNTALEQEATKLDQKNTALGKEAAELNRKIRGMETSFSWKITSPLRYLKRKLKVTARFFSRESSTHSSSSPSSRGSTPFYLSFWIAPILLGLLCFVVYNANLRQIGSGDTVPARYLPLILWKYGTFDFDANARLIAQGHPMFADRNRPAGAAGKVLYFDPSAYWKVRTQQHQIASLYPVVTPLLVTPLYWPAVMWLNAHGWEQPQIDRVAELMEKLSASFLASLASVMMYLVLRRECGRWSLPLALVFAFGTNTWMISSQALWQHAGGELLIALALLLIVFPASTMRLALLGGVCVLMASNRPPDALIAAAIVLFTIWSHKRRALWLLAGATLPLVLLMCYNLEFIGHIVGGYALEKNPNKKFFQLDWTGLPGLLISPSRGLLVFSPFLVFLPAGLILRLREPGTRGLAVALSFAVAAQLLLYSQADWRAGGSWGPRWLTDLLPILVWMLAPALLVMRPLTRGLLVATMAAAVIVQGIGAFWYTKTSDDLILAGDLYSMQGAWNFGNVPFLSELRHPHAPAELLHDMAGSIDRIGSTLSPRAGKFPQLETGAALEGWTLVDKRAPAQMLLLINGIVVGSTQNFLPREDVNKVWPGASPSGWSVSANLQGVPAGRQVLQLAGRIGSRSNIRIVREQPVFVIARDLPGERAAVPEKPVPVSELDAMAARAAALLRERQSREGFWLTAYTKELQYKAPQQEMNTFLTSILVDLLSPIASRENLGDAIERARRHLTAQIEGNGLVRYHGLPDGSTIGSLGCVITPDADTTALAWRISGLGTNDSRMQGMLKKLAQYRDARGLYRTWLAPKKDYQNLDPGRDTNPTDIGIQLHVYLMLRKLDPPAAKNLCQALQRSFGDEDIWPYYAKAPLIPYLRSAEVRQLGCEISLPTERLALPATGQEIWSEAAHLLVEMKTSPESTDAQKAIGDLLARIGKDDFALLRSSPPLLYHNDLSAPVKRFYWSEDFGYALWLRLHGAVRVEPDRLRSSSP